MKSAYNPGPTELVSLRTLFRALALFIMLTTSVMAQTPSSSSDITGWPSAPWGTTKAAALKTLKPQGVHECNRAGDPICGAKETEALVIDNAQLFGTVFTLDLLFAPPSKHPQGLEKVILTAVDKRDAFEKVLKKLVALYGKPGLESEYDATDETVHTKWSWIKPHGTAILEAEEETGVFAITYEVRR
jgi:hypothetical protein